MAEKDIEKYEVMKDGDTFHYHITLIMKSYDCPYCGGKSISHGKVEKHIHHPTLIDFDSFIHYHARRYLCKECEKTFLERNPFAFENFKSSFALINRIMKQLGNLDMNFKRIAELNHVSITMVQLYLDSYVLIPRPSLPQCLGIDELHSKMSAKDSAYLCVLVDNENRYPIDILDSRSKNNLNRHFEKYPKIERDKVLFITIDMWRPYKDVALKQFKNCKVAVDPFHVVKHCCDAFTKVRIHIMNQCPYGSDAYYLLKKWHFLLEKNEMELDNEPRFNHHFHKKLNYRQLREMIFLISNKLLDAFNLKCAYQLFNETATFENCEMQLEALIQLFRSSEIVEYYDFISLLTEWKEEIKNSFLRPYDDRKLSNALAENINGKLRTYISITHGFQNFTRFRKRSLYALNPKIFFALNDRLSSNKIEKKSRGKYMK